MVVIFIEFGWARLLLSQMRIGYWKQWRELDLSRHELLLNDQQLGGIRKMIIHQSYSAVPLRALVLAVCMVAGLALPTEAIETPASSAVVIEVTTGKILLDKNADVPMAPASMSKLMTLYLLFERLKDGSLSLDDTFRIRENAWRKGAKSSGSTVFLPPRKR